MRDAFLEQRNPMVVCIRHVKRVMAVYRHLMRPVKLMSMGAKRVDL